MKFVNCFFFTHYPSQKKLGMTSFSEKITVEFRTIENNNLDNSKKFLKLKILF